MEKERWNEKGLWFQDRGMQQGKGGGGGNEQGKRGYKLKGRNVVIDHFCLYFTLTFAHLLHRSFCMA